MLFEDEQGNILSSEEVDNLSLDEMDDRTFHLYDGET
jgi:hypothetical protein